MHGSSISTMALLTPKLSIKFQKIFQHPLPTILTPQTIRDPRVPRNILTKIIVYILYIANIIIETQKCSYFSNSPLISLWFICLCNQFAFFFKQNDCITKGLRPSRSEDGWLGWSELKVLLCCSIIPLDYEYTVVV